MRRRVFEKVISSILTLALTIQPALLHAQNIQPVNPNTGPRPHVDQSLNGTTVINISTPNGAGVSHDVYTDFQANDLILNNSATITNTQLGGVIEGNGNLTPGQEANLWVGEVVGGNQTQLNGILEVAGQRMDVVVANEFGITCQGCGFINTGRATLTTGKPQFAGNGALTGFDVRRGTVTIGAGGLNPENRIGLTDTSRVDVIARAAAIYGKMRADQLNVVAGANQVDYNWSYDPETGAVTGITEQAGEGAAPALAVDVAALGGMYANAIRLIATENGVGVHLNGDMASSTNIALRADGKLTLGAPAGGHTPQIRAGGRIQVRNQGPILLEGAITSESGDLIDIRTSNGDLIFNGQAAGGAIRLESAGMLNISGAIVAREAVEAASTGASVALNGTSEIFARSIDVDALTQLTFKGKGYARETASLTAGTGLVTGASSELVADSVTLTGDDARIGGQVQALEDLTIAATDGNVDHRGTSRGQAVTISGDAVQTSDGSQIAAIGDLSVTAADQAKISGELVAGKGLTLKSTAAGVTVETKAEILANSVNLAAQARIDFDGKAAAVETASLTAGTELATGDNSELVAGSVVLTGDSARIGGQAQAREELTIEATGGSVEHTGMARGQTVAVSGESIQTSNGSKIAAGGDLDVTAVEKIILRGELAAGSALTLESNQAAITVETGAEVLARSLQIDARTRTALYGKATALGTATLAAGTDLVTGTSSELVAESVALSGGTVQIEGQAQALESLTIEATDGSIDHTGTSRGQDVTLTGDTVHTGNSSQIAAVKSLLLTSAEQADIDGELVAGEDLTLQSTGDAITIGTGAEILAGSLDIEAQTRLAFDGKATVTDAAKISAGSELATGAGSELIANAITLTGISAQSSGELRAIDGLTIEATDGALEHSGVSRGQNVSIIGDTVETGDTSQIAAVDGLTVTAADQILLDGELASRAKLAITSTGASIRIEDGAELVADSLDVDAQTQVALNGRAAVQNRAELKAGASLTTGNTSEIVAGSIAFSGTTAQIAGQAEAQDSVSIEARDGTLEHSGRSRGRSVTLSGDHVQTGENSQIAAIADVQVTATDRAVIDGTMIAGQRADLSVTAGDLDLQGQINARNTNITISGQTSLGAEALAVGQSVLELQSGSLNGGLRASHFDQLRAGDGLAVTLETGGLTVAASERVEFGGDLLLDLDGDLENRGTIKASGNLQLRSGTDLNNRGGLLKSGETMQLVARDGTILNQSGRIEADGGLAIEAQSFINRFTSLSVDASAGQAVIDGSYSFVRCVRRNSDGCLESETVVVPVSQTVTPSDPRDLPPQSCYSRVRQFSGQSGCGGVFAGTPDSTGTVTWTQGTAVDTTGAQPEVLSGAGIAIAADTVRNDAGLVSAANGINIASGNFENTAYEDTRTTSRAAYSKETSTEVSGGGFDGNGLDYDITDIKVGTAEIIRQPDPDASLIGTVLAGAAININGSTVHTDGNIRAGTNSVVSPRDNSAVASALLPDLIVPTASLTPVQPDVLNLPALDPVQPDVVNRPSLVPVRPDVLGLPALAPVQPDVLTMPDLAFAGPRHQDQRTLETLIRDSRTNFGTTPVSFEDLLSSDYFLDRLQIQNELFQNINRPTEWNGYQRDSVSFEGGYAVQTPDLEFVGFGDRFGLSESGVLASLDKANTSENGDLTIIAGSITGSGGSLIAEGGSLSLTSLGNITFEDTELGADLVDIITGGDFSGKALVIRSSSDTSVFAAGNVTIEGLAQTEEHYTNTSVTKITENLASRFDVGGDLSIISSADMTLAGVQAQVTGDTRLTAGGGLYLLAEQSGVQYSEGDAKNGTDRLTLTAQVTQISTGGDFIANAGGDAVLIGTQIDAGGKAHLAAAGDVVLAAAQDIAKSETRKTSSGFLSRKKETRSTLAVTNRGVGITAGGDIDVIAETGDLTTAGTEFASASGDINLTATEGNILVGTYTDVLEETHVKEKSYLGGLLSKSSQSHTVDHINTGTDALAALDLSIVSGSDTTLVGATLSAGQNLNIKTGGDFSVQAAIDSHRSEFFETDMGLVTMTTITETSFTESAVLTELLAGQGMNFDIGGDAELVLYQTAGVDAPNPQDLYPEELLAIDGLELISQELADEYFYEEKTQLSPAFKALVSIVVAAYVAPQLVGEYRFIQGDNNACDKGCKVMHEMENARQLLTYARTFFKGSLKTSNKIFSSSYGVASETRKQRRIACAKKSGYVLSKLREHDTRKSLHILYSCFPQDRAGNCCEYVDVAINHGVKLQVPNIWSVIHDLHQLLVLANTPGFNISTLSEFKRYEDNDFWVCDPWFNIHCRMHLYGLMIVSKSSQWQHEGKEIYLDNGTAEPASMLYPRLSLEKIEFTQMTDHEGKATNGWEQRLSSKLTFLPS